MRKILFVAVALLLIARSEAAEPNKYLKQAHEVTEHINNTFYDPASGVYRKYADKDKLDYVWLQSVAFANLVAAARNEPERYAPQLDKYFVALDGYWDDQTKIPGYEAAPTQGNGTDKYYDDNAWMAITLIEAYETNQQPRYLQRADETLAFVLSGWDDEIGGGIWWHQKHKDGTKNTCSNGPSAVACLQLAKFQQKDAAELTAWAEKIVAWTCEKLQDDDGLFDDRVVVATGEIKRGKLTYNTALIIRAQLGLYRATGEQEYLDQAKRLAKASDWFLAEQTGIYRDALRYAHFMVEADLELYRTTKEPYLLERARRNVDAWYENWQANKPNDMMTNACLGRALWLMGEAESEPGQTFWQHSDQLGMKK